MEADYEDVPLFSKIRWLSGEKTLKHFFALRKEILYFLQSEKATTKEYQIQLSDVKFIGSLAFLIGISNHLNMVNVKLQGKKQFISQLVGHIEGFRKKLVLFKASLQKKDASHFPSCCELLGEGTRIDFCAFSTKIGEVTD